jgi:acetylornithine/succinyldiaminopimelate/putrescine aminotransferase/predicted amino acid dehydrogenase
MDWSQEYHSYCKPKLAELLSALKLDICASSAKGNYIQDESGKQYLDLVSGFGSAILGHNHLEIVKTATDFLQKNLPINVQGTVRSSSAKLARRLNELLPPNSESYCVNFSNSGTESIEAAIKHAYKVHFDKVQRKYEQLSRVLNDFYYKVDNLPNRPEIPGKNKSLVDFRDDLDEYNLEQFETFQNNPVMIGFKGGFHGKTMSSLKVTFNKSFREIFEGLSSIKPVFIDPKTPERIKEISDEQTCLFLYPELVGNKIELRTTKITKVIGLIFEIVMGEGGIIPLSDRTLEYLANEHKNLQIPYIIDEIQTGCGRTGEIFGYTDTALSKISPEYIALSKALGGGVAKIGATLIRKNIYEHDFGILHTSTFGEDDLSSEVALKTLELLTQNNNAQLNDVKEKGQTIVDELRGLQREYPDIIKDVRGRGLMIGLEFTALEGCSPFFRASGKQGVLSLLIASYLLEYHNIRVLAPLTNMLKGNPGKIRLSVIRIQPPLAITKDEIQKLISGLKEVCNIIQNNNEYCLIGHLIGASLSSEELKNCIPFKARWPIVDEPRSMDARAGFVVNPTNLNVLAEYYFPSFEKYSWKKKILLDWWNSISRFLEPIHIRNEYITSNEFTIQLSLVFVPYLPEYINANRKDPILAKEMNDKVQDAVTVARELGDDNIPVSIVGLGGYTSIMTKNALTINDYEIPVTTGNAYTTGLAIQGVIYAAQQRKIDMDKAKLAIVGAGGNIGSILAQILIPRVDHLVLIGSQKPDSEARLRTTRQLCLQELLKNIQAELSSGKRFDNTSIQGVGYQVYKYLQRNSSEVIAKIKSGLTSGKFTPKLIQELDEELFGENSDIRLELSTSIQNSYDCDIIILSTNSENPDLIKPEFYKPEAILCCVSLPSNISENFKNSSGQLAFDGSLARLPEGSEINFVGMPKRGLTYGCLSETLVLAFEGHNHSYSKGEIKSKQVYDIMEKGLLNGFDLGSLKLNDKIMLERKSI